MEGVTLQPGNDTVEMSPISQGHNIVQLDTEMSESHLDTSTVMPAEGDINPQVALAQTVRKLKTVFCMDIVLSLQLLLNISSSTYWLAWIISGFLYLALICQVYFLVKVCARKQNDPIEMAGLQRYYHIRAVLMAYALLQLVVYTISLIGFCIWLAFGDLKGVSCTLFETAFDFLGIHIVLQCLTTWLLYYRFKTWKRGQHTIREFFVLSDVSALTE